MESQSQFGDIQDKIQSQQIYIKPKKQMNYQSSLKSGPWVETQNLKYIVFVDKNRTNLTSKSKRRVGKVFKEMSLSIGTRNAIQCRSHHQKQLEKFRNISKIITLFRREFSDQQQDRKAQEIGSLQLNANLNSSRKQREDVQRINGTVQTIVQTQIAGNSLKTIPEDPKQSQQQFLCRNNQFFTYMQTNQIFPLLNFPYGFLPFWLFQLPEKQG